MRPAAGHRLSAAISIASSTRLLRGDGEATTLRLPRSIAGQVGPALVGAQVGDVTDQYNRAPGPPRSFALPCLATPPPASSAIVVFLKRRRCRRASPRRAAIRRASRFFAGANAVPAQTLVNARRVVGPAALLMNGDNLFLEFDIALLMRRWFAAPGLVGETQSSTQVFLTLRTVGFSAAMKGYSFTGFQVLN